MSDIIAVNRIMSDFQLDLIAVFMLLLEDVFKQLDESAKEGKMAEDIINDIENLF